MLNYTESTHSSTPVPFLVVPCIKEPEALTEPLPETAKQQGREVGQADARQVLARAKQHKGAPLTKPEMQEAAYPLVMARLEEVETSDKPKEWYNGWGCGYMQALLDAERTAAPEPPTSMANLQPEVLLVAGSVPIRRAVIETESIDDLRFGIVCGQDCYVDLSSENSSIRSHDLACLFAETMESSEPEAYNVGFVVGVVDALLCARKTYPRG
jgi:hypothetical protein